MSDRLADNIRRIVGNERRKARTLGTADYKESIDGNRGASFAPPGSSGATNSTATSGSAGQDLSSFAPAFDTSGYGHGTGQDGASVDPDDPSKALIENGGNQYDVEDILDGNGPGFFDPSATDGGGDYAFDESMDGITGLTDCTTGKDLCIYLKNGTPPPDGWESNELPPDNYYDGTITPTGGGPNLFEWIQGTRYFTTLAGTSTQVFFPNAAAGIDYIAANSLSPDPTISSITWDSGIGPGAFRVRSNSDAYQELLFIDNSCDVGVESACPVNKPSASELSLPDFPVDNCHAIAFQNGKLQSSSQEPQSDRVDRLMGDQSRIDFCFGSGRFGAMELTKNGGYMIYETASEGGAISGIGTVFNAKSQAVTTLTEANEVIQWRP